MEDNKYAIEVNDVYKSFNVFYDKTNTIKEKMLFWNKSKKEVRTVLKGINLKIKKGEVVALIGVNGSGKSTLVQLMNALLLPTGGTIQINEQVVSNNKRKNAKIKFKLIRAHIGLVFQFPEYQLFEDTVMKDILFGPKNFGMKPEEAKQEADKVIKLLKIPEEILDRSPFSISGGQMRKAAIAGILASNPSILILDEPTTGLDPQTRKTLWSVIEKYRRDEKMTVFLTTHYMEEASDADYVVILDAGKISAEGTPLELKNNYTGDYITIYGVSEEEVRKLNHKYEKIRDAYRVSVANTEEARDLIVNNQELFKDFEITKGKMDDVFLSVTGKKLVGGN